MRVCLFEDGGVGNLEPLALTRPAFDLLCGQTTLGSKQCRYFAPCELGVLVRPHLADLYRLHHPTTPVNDLSWLRAEPTILVNSRWLPPAGLVTHIARPCVALVGDEVAFAVVGTDRLTYCSENTLADCLEVWKQTLPRHEAGGLMISYLWDLVANNGEQLTLDFQQRITRYRLGWRPDSLAVVGSPERLFLDPTARIDPFVVVDTTQGPIMIDREAVVSSFSRIEGPCYVGPHAQVLGAKIRAGTTLGPHCRIGGEVEASIVHGHSNKYHDGFLGHSYVGEWVNLGAGTQNSDLRNDYGPVTVWVNGRRVHSGQSKVGCFLGDHTKTGLGTLINTGTSVGAFCNLLPAGLFPPKCIPSFCSWWNGALRGNDDLPALFHTAHEVMRRRDDVCTDTHVDLFRALFRLTEAERQRVLRDEQQRPRRRAA